MRAALVLAFAVSMSSALLAQTSHRAEPRSSTGDGPDAHVTAAAPPVLSKPATDKPPTLVEIAARVRRVVEEHEQRLAADRSAAPRKTEGSTGEKPKPSHAAKRAVKTSRVGLVWRVSLVWPKELTEDGTATSAETK
jgi:hypothetical protein